MVGSLETAAKFEQIGSKEAISTNDNYESNIALCREASRVLFGLLPEILYPCLKILAEQRVEEARYGMSIYVGVNSRVSSIHLGVILAGIRSGLK